MKHERIIVYYKSHGRCIESLKEREQKETDTLSLKCIMAVRLVMQGYKGLDVADVLGIHRQPVSTYIHSFNQGGMHNLLACGKAPGCLSYLSEQEEQEVWRVLTDSTPAEEGIEQESYWDTRVLQAFLEDRFSIFMIRSGIGEMLKRWRFRCTRSPYCLVRVDPTKQAALQRDIDMIKNLSDDMIFLYEDETHIRDDQALHTTWAPFGKQKKVQTRGHHAKLELSMCKPVRYGAWNRPHVMPSCSCSFFSMVLRVYPRSARCHSLRQC